MNYQKGNLILLFTDGQENCELNSKFEDLDEELLTTKTKLISVALGPSADSRIEDLAMLTGGRSFYVADDASMLHFREAFKEIEKSQPPGKKSNTPILIHQKDFLLNSYIQPQCVLHTKRITS